MATNLLSLTGRVFTQASDMHGQPGGRDELRLVVLEDKRIRLAPERPAAGDLRAEYTTGTPKQLRDLSELACRDVQGFIDAAFVFDGELWGRALLSDERDHLRSAIECLDLGIPNAMRRFVLRADQLTHRTVQLKGSKWQLADGKGGFPDDHRLGFEIDALLQDDDAPTL